MKLCNSCGKMRPPGSFQSSEPVCATCWATPPEPLNSDTARTLLRDWAYSLTPAERKRTVKEISETDGRLFDALKLVSKDGKTP